MSPTIRTGAHVGSFIVDAPGLSLRPLKRADWAQVNLHTDADERFNAVGQHAAVGPCVIERRCGSRFDKKQNLVEASRAA